MEHVLNTLNDLVIFLVMILIGGITWFVSNLALSKVISNQRVYEVISIILGLSVGVIIIMNSWNLTY
jgi:uncharacterized membrane protein|tara:strand:- start:2255 stop:2455 length:201 start_codon:yes stop_codon:yes gene_type:complete